MRLCKKLEAAAEKIISEIVGKYKTPEDVWAFLYGFVKKNLYDVDKDQLGMSVDPRYAWGFESEDMIETANNLANLPESADPGFMHDRICQYLNEVLPHKTSPSLDYGVRPDLAFELITGIPNANRFSGGDASVLAAMAFGLALLPEEMRTAVVAKIKKSPTDYPEILKNQFTSYFTNHPEKLPDAVQRFSERWEFMVMMKNVEKLIPQTDFYSSYDRTTRESSMDVWRHMKMASGDMKMDSQDNTASHVKDWKKILDALPEDVQRKIKGVAVGTSFTDGRVTFNKRELVAPIVVEELVKQGKNLDDVLAAKRLGDLFPKENTAMRQQLDKTVTTQSQTVQETLRANMKS